MATTRAYLPIDDTKDDILSALRKNQVVVIRGETGSGKTTQLPQIVMEAPFFQGTVVITQPRRVAAVSVARRVASEQNCRTGDLVGYTIRFEDVSSSSTRIKYVTDGVLVREFLMDPLLKRYHAIILDEAHERSMHTDVLLGLVKRAAQKRKDLKVIITSATLDVDKFSAYFNQCPILNVPGREYPVDIYHSKSLQVMTSDGPSTKTYLSESIELVLKIHKSQPPGHILVFLTGQDEIDKVCSELRKTMRATQFYLDGPGEHHKPYMSSDDEDDTNHRHHVQGGKTKTEPSTEAEDEEDVLKPPSKLEILPLYAMLSVEDQTKIFENVDASRVRKVIVATNIAETSVTVPGVKYVIDPGYVKQKAYDPTRGMESLVIVPTSKVAAQQRAGRAGRTSAGQCFRLYSKLSFDRMLDESIPEILRINLASVVLSLKALKINDVIGFDYFESPSMEGLEEALLNLHALGALNSEDGSLTEHGLKMSKLPLDPRLSRVLLQAEIEECLDDVLIITSMLTTEVIWNQRPNKQRSISHSKDSEPGHYGSSNNNERRESHRYGSGGGGDRFHASEGGGGSMRFNNASSYSNEPLSEEELMFNAHSRFSHVKGDHMTLLNVWQKWGSEGTFSDKWVRENYLRPRAMRVAKLTHTQLNSEVEKLGLSSSSSPSSRFVPIMRSFTAGFCLNTARRCSDGIYKLLPQCKREGQRLAPQLPFVYIQPSSSNISFENSQHVLFQDLVATSKPYMRLVLAVDDVDWLNACRKNMSKQHVNVSTLCGRKPQPSPAPLSSATIDSPHNKSTTQLLLNTTKKKRSVEETVEHVMSARERYLARKKKS